MWHFVSPDVVFGVGALEALDQLSAGRVLVVTDATLVELGLVDRVTSRLTRAGFETHLFAEVESDPSVQTVCRGVTMAQEIKPDWIVGLGGGSPLDAAKAVWVLYERPDLQPPEINPFIDLGLGQKARLITIPTTSGTGAEVTWGIVLTDTVEQRKMGLGNREIVAELAIVDPTLAASMPPVLTADTGMDALTHAVEGYACTWHTDLTDGFCLKAAIDIFSYLPRAVGDGTDMEARERMHNAATCAGLGFGNAMASLAHAMGHALGAAFHLPHGRAVGLFLPYTVDFAARGAPERFSELSGILGLSTGRDEEGCRALAARIRDLAREIGSPTSVCDAGIEPHLCRERLDELVDNAFNDTQIVTAPRTPTYAELTDLFLCAFHGRDVDF